MTIEGQEALNTAVDATQTLADEALTRYAVPAGAIARLINVSENATFSVETSDANKRWALRLHREGYHSPAAIRSELAWLNALNDSATVQTPKPVSGRDGALIQTLQPDGHPAPRHVVMFEWEAGAEPSATDPKGFEQLGAVAARMHAQVRQWNKPEGFERFTWDFETMLGAKPHWGAWRDGMGMTPEIEAIFARTVDLIEQRLRRFGKGADRFGLVHGDMRLANLLIDGQTVKVIDFDDCGFSWFLYDCATTVSFFEDAPEAPELLAAWVRGYRTEGTLSAEDEAEIGTFVMLRRLLLVAWIGSHSETDLAQSMGIAYTRATVPLCERYLSDFAL